MSAAFWTDIEADLLGRAMLDDRQWGDVCEIVSASDFSTALGQAVFRKMAAIRASGAEVSPAIMARELLSANSIVHAEYAAILELSVNTFTTGSQAQYATAIREESRKRTLISAARDVLAGGSELSSEDMAAMLVAACNSMGTEAGQAAHLSDALEPAYRFADLAAEARRQNKTIGVPTGIAEVDAMTSGYAAGELVIVAARTSVGKTAFVNQSCMHAAASGCPGLIISLEEQYEGIGMRVIASSTAVKIGRIRHGYETSDSLRAAVDRTDVAGLPIWICTSAHRLSKILAMIGAYRRKYRIQWAVVDHIGLVDIDTASPKVQRYEKVGHMTASCKRLAQSLGIPIVLVSQISRAGANERPELIHLRESGNIEQDANTIIALHRKSADASPGPSGQIPPASIEIGVLKARYGVTGWIATPYEFDGSHQTFRAAHR